MSLLPTVLLVDDLAANRETLRELLSGQDCLLVEASGGAQALELASANSPDLVLLDVMMPEIDGYEVCRRLRANPQLAEVPIIMVTALDDQASRLAGIEAGADDFLSKPLNRLELCARVRTITRLNRYRRLHEQRGQFQWVVELSSNGYVLVNAADEILFANPSARLWLGLAPETGDGNREQFLVAARRTFLSHPDGSWQGWPDIPTDSLAFPRLLVRPETPQASAFFLEVSVHESSGGRLLRLCDATEQVAVRRDQRAFQMMVSHKLRTPLNGILGSLEVLMMDGAGVSAAEIAEFVLMAHQSAERLAAAVKRVLRYAERSQRPAAGSAFGLAGLEPLVRSVADELGLMSPPVSVDGGALPLAIPCSLEMIEWVLFELLENARKFHPDQAPAVEVTARLAACRTEKIPKTRVSDKLMQVCCMKGLES